MSYSAHAAFLSNLIYDNSRVNQSAADSHAPPSIAARRASKPTRRWSRSRARRLASRRSDSS